MLHFVYLCSTYPRVLCSFVTVMWFCCDKHQKMDKSLLQKHKTNLDHSLGNWFGCWQINNILDFVYWSYRIHSKYCTVICRCWWQNDKQFCGRWISWHCLQHSSVINIMSITELTAIIAVIRVISNAHFANLYNSWQNRLQSLRLTLTLKHTLLNLLTNIFSYLQLRTAYSVADYL